MLKICTLLVFLSITSSIAQNILVSQDFSSGTDLSTYVGNGAGQIPWTFEGPNSSSISSGLVTALIVNNAMQLDLRSTVVSGSQVSPSIADFNYNVGSTKLLKLQFSLNYERLADGTAPKPLILWLNNEPILYFGRDNPSEYFVANDGVPYFSDGGVSAGWFNSQGGAKFTGVQDITVIVNYTNSNQNYNSLSYSPYTFRFFVNGVVHKYKNWRSGRNYNDPFLNVKFYTPRHNGSSLYGGPMVGPLPTHRISLDNIVIEDLSDALPVKLSIFVAKSENNLVRLNWKTTEELNSNRFEVEHSTNSKNWTQIEEIVAAGTSADIKNYEAIHNSPPSGINYYRLKMIDNDKTFAYSQIRSVQIESQNQVILYPNPAEEYLFIKSGKQISTVLIKDEFGRLFRNISVYPSNGIDIRDLNSGIYIISIEHEDGDVVTGKIIVKK